MSNSSLQAGKYVEHLQSIDPIRVNGKVTQVIGLTVESEGPDASIGDVCYIYPNKGAKPIKAEVVGFRNNKVILMPLGDLHSISSGCDVVGTGKPLSVQVGSELLGKVLDGLGQPLDGSFYQAECSIILLIMNQAIRLCAHVFWSRWELGFELSTVY